MSEISEVGETRTLPDSLSGVKYVTPLAALATASIGLLVLIGWKFDNSALAFLLSGVSLWLLRKEKVSLGKKIIASGLALGVVVLGGLTIGEVLFGMPPLSAYSFVLLGIALLCFNLRRSGPLIAQFLALFVAPVSLFTFLGYVYGLKPQFPLAAFTQMPLSTSVAFGILSVGILTARPTRGFMKIFASDSVAGITARRLLPAVLLIPCVMGWLRLMGQRAGFYGTEFGLALFVVLIIMIFGIVVFLNAASLYEVDRKRKWAEAMMRHSYEDLERRVEDRTLDLRQANERLKKLDEMKSNFVALASHELKTPLTAMKGCLSLISQGKAGVLTRKQHELMNVVEEASGRLHRLVDDLLDISGIDLGQIKMNFEPASLKTLLREELMVVRAQAREKGIDLEERLEDPIKDIHCDRDRIREVIDNLLSNALKYTPPGGRVQVELRSERQGARLEVRDTGIGIPSEEQERIFEPFQHIKKAGLSGEKSTGLGLALVRKIIDAHGGAIRVQSGEGQGATFSVFLPQNHGEKGGRP
ncbi:MAG: HAMP domain-containing histidine kinase [Candidatus Omnitrophica bacterium]|nr:HAMP domain-containing histidine kinase [Candidatus Omnitrophota bacterium]